jgi:hypothetical protein
MTARSSHADRLGIISVCRLSPSIDSALHDCSIVS